MNRNKHKILVLSDLKENAKDTVAYAITVAKEINGALELLCVRKPNEVVTIDNSLSAIRSVSNAFIKTEQKAKNLIKSITKDDFFAVKNKIEFGNIKNEIENYIQLSNPDVIIIGKKQKKLFNLNGDNVTGFILNKYNTKVCIANTTSISDIYAKLERKKNIGQTA
jgi:nucleotide-binding universal stress UspA family protein